MHLRHLFVSLLLLFLISGCHSSHPLPELVTVDSLLLTKHDQMALDLLIGIDTHQLGKDDQAYYALLITQAHYKNYIVATTDSLINVAVDHYQHSDDHEKYVRSLIYQGCVNEELGNLEKAVACYHQAEVEAERQSDKRNLAFSKLRLAFLYHSQVVGSELLSINKYKEALKLYTDFGDRHYEGMCYGEIGALFRKLYPDLDSALYYLDKAIEIEREQGYNYGIFSSLFIKAEHYASNRKDYQLAIAECIKALEIGGEEVDHPRAHYCVASSYLHLGKKDSAMYFLNLAPADVTPLDSMMHYVLLTDLAQFDRKSDEAFHYYQLADNMSDSILMAGLNHRLLAVEKKYDKQQVELENEQLQSRLLRTLFYLALSLLLVLALSWWLVSYRQRLKHKAFECRQVQAELSESLHQLQHMERSIAAYQGELEHSQASIIQLKVNQEHADKLRAVLKEQMRVVEKLLRSSREMKSDKFMEKFYSVMTLPSQADEESYWKDLHTLANSLHNNVLHRAQQAMGGTLRDDEINYLALVSCGFAASVVMVCMRYKSIGTVYNKRSELSRKLNVEDLSDFI